MKKCCSGLAVVLVSLVAFGIGHAQVNFHGVLNPNARSVWVDTVIITVPPTPETIITTGWGSDSVAFDTFDFPSLTVWPVMVELHARIDTLYTVQTFPAPQNGTWYVFLHMPPPQPKVMFYEPTGVEEPGTGIASRPRLSVSPSVLTDQVTIQAQVAGRGAVRLEVVDAAGNRVRSFSTSGRTVTMVWHGDDDAGHSLPEGIYFCRLAVGEATSVAKVLLAR
jgi:hypothetical protein